MSTRCNADLKMKDMYLVESYRAYHILLQKMSENKCHGCIKLKEHISLMREQKMYKDQLNELKFQMSDEALQQMPEFQGRVRFLHAQFSSSCVLLCAWREKKVNVLWSLSLQHGKIITILSFLYFFWLSIHGRSFWFQLYRSTVPGEQFGHGFWFWILGLIC